MDSYVIVANFHRTETSLLWEDTWNNALAIGNSALLLDADNDLMYVIQYFNASSWDEARAIYDAWAYEAMLRL